MQPSGIISVYIRTSFIIITFWSSLWPNIKMMTPQTQSINIRSTRKHIINKLYFSLSFLHSRRHKNSAHAAICSFEKLFLFFNKSHFLRNNTTHKNCHRPYNWNNYSNTENIHANLFPGEGNCPPYGFNVNEGTADEVAERVEWQIKLNCVLQGQLNNSTMLYRKWRV